ncbi:MAG: hypothetical protein Q9P14_09865, partial [candidate division KSB1 bacterium]|nr:hypothetical protein [candidate division KSB1 bacterium]
AGRGALLYGASPDVLEDHSGNNGWGSSFLDVYKAHQVFGVRHPQIRACEIQNQFKKLGIKVMAMITS